jgi:transposase-like protein
MATSFKCPHCGKDITVTTGQTPQTVKKPATVKKRPAKKIPARKQPYKKSSSAKPAAKKGKKTGTRKNEFGMKGE